MPDELFDEFVLLGELPGAFTEGERFRGGVTVTGHDFCADDGIPHTVLRARLTYESGITLSPGSWVRRVRDGAEFLVTGGVIACTPAGSALHMAVTTVERTVYTQ